MGCQLTNNLGAASFYTPRAASVCFTRRALPCGREEPWPPTGNPGCPSSSNGPPSAERGASPQKSHLAWCFLLFDDDRSFFLRQRPQSFSPAPQGRGTVMTPRVRPKVSVTNGEHSSQSQQCSPCLRARPLRSGGAALLRSKYAKSAPVAEPTAGPICFEDKKNNELQEVLLGGRRYGLRMKDEGQQECPESVWQNSR